MIEKVKPHVFRWIWIISYCNCIPVDLWKTLLYWLKEDRYTIWKLYILIKFNTTLHNFSLGCIPGQGKDTILGRVDCTPCDPGSYNDGSRAECILCPSETPLSDEGATDVSNCTELIPGPLPCVELLFGHPCVYLNELPWTYSWGGSLYNSFNWTALHI